MPKVCRIRPALLHHTFIFTRAVERDKPNFKLGRSLTVVFEAAATAAPWTMHNQ
jgi:hypothetical protein